MQYIQIKRKPNKSMGLVDYYLMKRESLLVRFQPSQQQRLTDAGLQTYLSHACPTVGLRCKQIHSLALSY